MSVLVETHELLHPDRCRWWWWPTGRRPCGQCKMVGLAEILTIRPSLDAAFAELSRA
jgi:hypothetical protein